MLLSTELFSIFCVYDMYGTIYVETRVANAPVHSGGRSTHDEPRQQAKPSTTRAKTTSQAINNTSQDNKPSHQQHEPRQQAKPIYYNIYAIVMTVKSCAQVSRRRTKTNKNNKKYIYTLYYSKYIYTLYYSKYIYTLYYSKYIYTLYYSKYIYTLYYSKYI